MSGGPSLPSNPAPVFQYPNQPQAAQGALGGISNLNVNPNASYNAPASTNAGSALTTTGTSVLPYVSSTLASGFDPQNALFAQLFQKQQDQSRANNAASGVATTPYGAGVVDQNNQLFDINWQNQQLARQGQGANNAATLIGAGSTGATSGTSVGQSVPGFSNQQVQQQIADFLAYLQGGTGAANAATSQYGAESSAALGQQTATNQGLAGFGQLGGTLLGGLGSLFGGA